MCTHDDCVEHRDDGPGRGTRVHKSVCHDDCMGARTYWAILNRMGARAYWASVNRMFWSEEMLFKHSKLDNIFISMCSTMNWNGFCKKCEHHWWHHEYECYELYETKVTITKGAVENADSIEWMTEMVRGAEDEQKQTLAALVKFRLFLKKNSIMAYNDVMLEYFDHLIRQESACVNRVAQNGGSSTSTGGERLDSLEKLRDEYNKEIQEIGTLTGTEGGESLDLDGVDQLVQSLYKLPLWGQSLKDTAADAASADLRAYREKPFCTRVSSATKAGWADIKKPLQHARGVVIRASEGLVRKFQDFKGSGSEMDHEK